MAMKYRLKEVRIELQRVKLSSGMFSGQNMYLINPFLISKQKKRKSKITIFISAKSLEVFQKLSPSYDYRRKLSKIRRKFMNHRDNPDLNLTAEEKCDLDYLIKSKKFHFILRNQILMNSIPKRLKKRETGQQRGPHETHSLGLFLKRVSHCL